MVPLWQYAPVTWLHSCPTVIAHHTLLRDHSTTNKACGMVWDGETGLLHLFWIQLWYLLSLFYSVLEISEGIIQNKNMAMHHVWLEILNLQT